ncbi:MAG: glutaredoxin 3 [Mariprofundaceae bacterium]
MASIEVYSGPMCPYCIMAKQLLKRLDLSFEEFDVRRDSDKMAEMLARSGGARTIPQIFINGRHVGGYNELSALHRRKELDGWLKTDEG